MNQTEFQRILEDLQKEAESRGGQIDMEAIRARFSREPLSEEHLGLICEYLLSRKILVSGYEKKKEKPEEKQALLPEDDKFLRRYREEMSQIRSIKSPERKELFRRAAAGEAGAAEQLARAYQPFVADLAEEMYVPQVPAADLVQEGNLHLMLALRELTEKEADPHRWLLARIREGMQALVRQQEDQSLQDRKMVKRVDELKENISALKEKLGRRVYLDELAEYMKISEDEVEAVLKLAGEEVPEEE